MAGKQTGAGRKIGWSDIMRVHVDSIGKADRETGRWAEASESDSGREGAAQPSQRAAAQSSAGEPKDGDGME